MTRILLGYPADDVASASSLQVPGSLEDIAHVATERAKRRSRPQQPPGVKLRPPGDLHCELNSTAMRVGPSVEAR